ncbi:MAG: DUF11 domain-containing protein, partial [Actinomycetota bacterium]|nr:DUF11 domain-containing protein [Actinomycetota bacterium]
AQEEAGLPVTPMRVGGAPADAGPEPPTPDAAEPPPPPSPPSPPSPPPPPSWGEPVDASVTGDTLLRAGAVRPPAAQPGGPPERTGRRRWSWALAAAGALALAGGAALMLRTVGTAESSEADLSVRATELPNGEVGRDLTYELTIVNSGPSDASEVTVVDAVPSAVVFKAALSHKSCRDTLPTITCRPGKLAKGSRLKVPLTITVPNPGRITHTATVSGSELDPRTDNNAAIMKTSVRGWR